MVGKGGWAGVQQWGCSKASLGSDSLAEPCRDVLKAGEMVTWGQAYKMRMLVSLGDSCLFLHPCLLYKLFLRTWYLP